MRWLVFFVLVLNVLTFAWFTFYKDQQLQLQAQNEQGGYDFASVPSLQLLGELPESEIAARDLRSVIPRTNSAEAVGSIDGVENVPDGGEAGGLPTAEMSTLPVGLSAATDDLCALIGSFPEMVTAKQAQGRLEKRGIKSQVVLILKELPAINWVYIAPRNSRKEALAVLKSLQEKNIDSFMIADGEYQNGISLGFFSQLESAQAVMGERRQQGYDVSITTKTREQKTYWLAFAHDISARVDKDMVSSLKGDVSDLKKQEKSCRDVALLQIIE